MGCRVSQARGRRGFRLVLVVDLTGCSVSSTFTQPVPTVFVPPPAHLPITVPTRVLARSDAGSMASDATATLRFHQWDAAAWEHVFQDYDTANRGLVIFRVQDATSGRQDVVAETEEW